MLPNHCLSIEVKSDDFLQAKFQFVIDVSRFQLVHWLVQSKCFQIIAFQLKSKDAFREVSQSFYSCICRCNPNPSKSKVSICFFAGAIQLQSNCFHFIAFQLNSNEFIEIPGRLSEFLCAYWQVQSTCFQAFAFQLRSNEFHEKLLKVSIRVLTGATKLSPSHCFLIQKQRIP